MKRPKLNLSVRKTALRFAGAVFFICAIASVAKTAKAAPATAPAATSLDPEAALVAKEKNRLEEAFIMKMVEELKLGAEMQKNFAGAIRTLNREKAKANTAIADALIDIDKAQNGDRRNAKKETESAVKKYEVAWRNYGDLPIREISRLRKILGIEKLARYLVLKSQVTEKITALSVNASDEKTLSDGASPSKPSN